MFDNIGGKIKATAKVFCWITIIASLILGILMLYGNAFGGVVFIIIGPLFAWIGSFVLYGFGELVENSCIQTELMVKREMEKEEQEDK